MSKIKDHSLKIVKKIPFFLLILLLLAFIFVFGLTNLKMFKQRLLLREKLIFLQNQLAGLEQERDTLQAEIGRSDALDYLERSAREDFNLKKQGEKVVAFPLNNPAESSKIIPIEEKENFLKRILNKLGF